MNIYELLEKEVLTEEEMEELTEMEEVAEVECNGLSGRNGIGTYAKAMWYTVKLINGEEFNVYI